MKSKRSSIVPVMLGILLANALIVDGYLIHLDLKRSDILGDSTDSSCPQACISRINQLSKSVTGSSSTKEYFVPLGSGSGQSTDWADVAGAASYIDTTSYGTLKKVTFEATTQIPSGGHRVWIRLYNATDKHPVWYSEMTTDESAATLLTSQPIVLDRGNNLYKVQMKTQLVNMTNLVQSRVKITTY